MLPAARAPCSVPSLRPDLTRGPAQRTQQTLWDARRGSTAHASGLGHTHPVTAPGEPFASNPSLPSDPVPGSALLEIGTELIRCSGTRAPASPEEGLCALIAPWQIAPSALLTLL